MALLASLFLLTATPAPADEPPTPTPGPRIADDDGDGIFDDLEEELAVAAPSQRFDTVVVLRKSLTPARLDALRGLAGDFGVDFEYHSIDGFAANLSKRQITALAKLDVVAQIEADHVVTPTLDQATLWFGVNKARTDFGVDGNADGAASYSTGDIVVAILDTGIDTDHVDLDGGKVLAWKDFINGRPNPYDEGTSGSADCSYHGTHVSSIAAGEGQGDPAFTGVAPGAALVGVKVLGIQTLGGQGKACVGTTSQVNSGIQWIIDNKDTYNIRVFNMSLGTSGCSDGTDSQSQLVNTAVAAGLIAVLSAGNEGPAGCTIGSPAAARDAITVGAMADPDHGPAASFGCGDTPAGGFYLACFSSRGPTADGRIKPDIAAPGVLIRAAAGDTMNRYKDLSGTSMATPFTTGTVALMLHADPNLTPAQVKTILMDTAVDWGTSGKDVDYGAGRLDAFEAVRTAASASGTNISVPNHQLIWGQLGAGSGSTNCASTATFDDYNISVSDPSLPLAVTLIMPSWGDGVDFDLCLFDKDGTQVDISSRDARQETVGIASASNGPYTLRVWAWPGSSGFPASTAGAYFFDISTGGSIPPPVSASLTTDGTTPFGSQGFNVTVDTTAGGTNDVQTIQVSTGPADLFIKTTLFANDENTWSLGTTSGANRVVWQFSTDGISWTTFTQADTLIALASSVPSSGTQDVYLRLTTPTTSASTKEHAATVTVVAVAP